MAVYKKRSSNVKKNKRRELDFISEVASCGEGLELFGEPEISFSKNIHIGKRCKINNHVYLNARSGITIGDDVTLSRGAKLISTGYDLDLFFNEGKRVHVTEGPIVGSVYKAIKK